MESSGLVLPKIVKFVTEQDVFSDELRLPTRFCLENGHRFGENLFLNFRNGYSLKVTFSKRLGTLFGLGKLYDDFFLEGRELLVFECSGDGNFNVSIIGHDFCEIDYPSIVHDSQKIRPRKVSLLKGGLKFVRFVAEADPVLDELVIPGALISRCVNSMPLKCFVRYVLPNGKKLNGFYDRSTQKVSGLQAIPELLGVHDLNSYNMLLFTYEYGGNLTLSVFDDEFVEVLFAGTPLSTVPSLPPPTVQGSFEIKIKPYMLLKYCYGVDISTQYRGMWHMWDKTDYIRVYSGAAVWKLQIRHRSNWERTTIHAGWLSFKDDMGLEVGDICIFECPPDSYDHFDVRVVKCPL